MQVSLSRCSAVIGPESTALLEARLAGKSVVQITGAGSLPGLETSILTPDIAHLCTDISTICEMVDDGFDLASLRDQSKPEEVLDAPRRMLNFVEDLRSESAS